MSLGPRLRRAVRLAPAVAAVGAALALSSCAPSEPFRITQATYPTRFAQGGPVGSVTVGWSGDPAFPLTVEFAPAAGCSTAAYTCDSFSSPAFGQASNPLVWSPGVACRGRLPPSTPAVTGPYFLYVVDAAGRSTQVLRVAVTCSFAPAPVTYQSLDLGSQPVIPATLRAADEVPWAQADVLRSIGLALLFLLLVAVPAHLAARTSGEPGAGHARHTPLPVIAGAMIVVAGAAWFLDGDVGLSAVSLQSLSGVALAVLAIALVIAGIRAAVHGIAGRHGFLRLHPLGALLAVGLALASRAAVAQPGLLVGVMLSHRLSDATVADRHERLSHWLSHGGLLAGSVIVWLLWTPVKAAAAGGSGPLVVLSTLMSTGFVGGVTSVVMGTLPLRWFDGASVHARHSLGAWLVHVVALFFLVHVVLDSAEDAAGSVRTYALAIVLAVLFAALMLWRWTRARRRRRLATGLSPR